ncbi:tetratricopeptide repeat protein [Methylocapsa polymorpha]|uniref:Tetratricopeptide repeat protein n=1 Tax=Methylocapsa polymorpha TaxID=3080828 RepID=A0ABZ0HX66_9HYPH|nr:tetratricopeptide repeat protein [Methylocapsa sp. RX1]
MSAQKSEQLDRGPGHAEIRNKALLQVAITEAFTCLGAGAPEEAIAHLEQFADLAAPSDVACYIFGLIYFNADDMRNALGWFERALALNSVNPEALGARAIVLQRLGQPLDAIESLEEILKLRPDDADSLFSIGVILQSLGRMKEALAAYESALRWRPNHCEASTNRGALLERFGRFEEALACFEAIAAVRPDDSRNLFNKGSVLQKLGRHEDALAAYEEAASCGPPDAETELNRGNVLQKLGRLEEALVCYDRSSQYRHGYPQALYNKGIALQGLGRLQEALAAYDAALALDPCYCEASCNRGNILHELGRLGEALGAYNDALKIRPGFLPALTNRANIFLQSGRAEQALLSCDEALRHDPRHDQALGIRGAALHKLGRLDEALAALDQTLQLRRDTPEAWLNRGNVLQELDRHAEAVASYDEALRIRPNYPEALSGLGVALKETGRIDEALVCFNEALEHKPAYSDARNNRAGALLLKGRLTEGFEDFESRWDRSNAPPRPFIQGPPQWNGENVQGKRIIVWDEQGLGDLIQFSRYLPRLIEAGADVTLLCRRNMRRLLRSLPKPVRFIDAIDPNEKFDFQSALLSLPRGFGTTLDTIPAQAPYLYAEPDLIAKWAERIGGEGFRIGICWHGNAFINLKRTVPLSNFASLGAIDGVRLISLMKDQSRIDAEGPDRTLRVESLGDDFDGGPDSFIDCAAAMATLDLIVTSDTAIVHLAGALGRPVVTALKHVPDWRWLMGRDDSPWYPTMRLFRQAEKDEWKPVFDRIADWVRTRATGRLTEGQQARKPALITIPGAIGELVDKITILEIKETHVADAAKLGNIRHELELLRKLKAEAGFGGAELDRLQAQLKTANALLWSVEDELRRHEARGEFGEDFISMARQVYKSNDLRAGLKKEINLLFNSEIVEEKSYSTQDLRPVRKIS